MFIATLNGIFRYKDVPEDMKPYVDFKASVDEVTPESLDEVAILDITGTTSHHVLFLKKYDSLDQIKEELEGEDAKINHTTIKILEGHI